MNKYGEEKYDVRLEVETDIHPLESVLLASYNLVDDAYIFLSGEDEGAKPGRLGIYLKPRKGDAERMAGIFLNELNRQSLRHHAARRNKTIRTQVVGRALTSAVPVEDDETEKAGNA